MATAVERYTMPSEFHQSKDDNLIPTELGTDDTTHSPRPSSDVDLPRAASYDYFPPIRDSLIDLTLTDPVKGALSGDTLVPDGLTADAVSPSSSGATTPELIPSPALEIYENGEERRKSALLRNGLPKLATSNATTERDKDVKTPVDRISKGFERASAELSRSPSSNSLTSRLRRRSWMPGSRSPSPRKSNAAPDSPADGLSTSGKGVRTGRRIAFRQSMVKESKENNAEKPVHIPTEKPRRSRSTSLSRRLSNRLRGRPLTTIVDGDTLQDATPPIPGNPKVTDGLKLPKSFSTEKLPLSTLKSLVPVAERMRPVPRAESQERRRISKTEAPRKRDELWTVFRTLDGDYQKFQSKPGALKANVIRICLLPFLRTYQNHPSVYKLRPEDLDRRATILNKWWSGLLELLHGKNNQSITGTDRPVIFEAIMGVMERPEWRLAPSPFCPLKERNSLSQDSHSPSSSSLSSQSSDFVAESVHHNVRNIFTQNILGQMCFVVEKMSMRSAPASLVSFCGKSCAYAFFFCPGIADVLVRLWNPTMDLLNRVLVESDIQRGDNLTDVSKAVCSGFPAHLQSLQYSTLSTTYRGLRKPAPLPLGTHHLPWSGVWVNRWAGKDSDLFYTFVKYFHLLVTEFLPHKASRKERICAPGLIFVHAQVLVNMDLTIHRNAAANEDSRQGASNITFDDVLSDPDSSAPALPQPPRPNATRSMAENRLIMLVRDFLSERGPNPTWVRQVFAQAFADLLKAAARRTSVYDHSACYILCDLLEEAVFILVRFEQLSPEENAFLDWPFWLDSWQQMVKSHNTTTEIRLYALLYSLWTPITIDSDRRAALCTSFLLQPEFFQSRFNHWCPMVRAYYMRLLCWRVARYDGENATAEGDAIYEQLSGHLHRTYSHYLFLRQHTEDKALQGPSTSPCNPAPGRRLLIVRTDPLFSQPRGSFLSFDNIMSQHSANFNQNPTLGEITPSDLRPESGGSSGTSDSDPDVDEKAGGKKWGLLRTIIGTSRQEQGNKSQNARRVGEGRPSSLPRDSAPRSSAAANGIPVQRAMQNGGYSNHKASHRAFSFKFSLEWVDRLDRRLQIPGPMRLQPPLLPQPAQQLLQDAHPASHPALVPSVEPTTFAGVSGAYGIDPSGSEGRGIEMKGSEPEGDAAASAKYSGRALAEWTLIVGECHSFFDRRKAEGVPGNRWVETPSLGVEAFKRPG